SDRTLTGASALTELAMNGAGTILYANRPNGIILGDFGTLAIYTRNTTNGAMSRQARLDVSDVVGVNVSPDGQFLYTVRNGNLGGSAPIQWELRRYRINSATSHTLEQTVRQGDPVLTPVTSLTQLVVSPDGRQVYAVAPAQNALLHFNLNTFNGQLTL